MAKLVGGLVMPEPLLKLHLIFAPNAPVAAILRQGPAKYMRLIYWDRRDNSFVDGQWIKNKVHPASCCLSPDGRHLCYGVTDYGRGSEHKHYWAISRMPYFTAVALYPEDHPYEMGEAYFTDNQSYVVTYKSKNIMPADPHIARVASGERASLRVKAPKPATSPSSARFVLADAELDFDQLYHTERGKLYRRGPEGALNLIRDVSDMEFESIIAPYAHGCTDRHPLDIAP